jgi:hypothetical protein
MWRTFKRCAGRLLKRRRCNVAQIAAVQLIALADYHVIDRAVRLTCSTSRTASKIAAKLSMQVFPLGDNIRCMLLLGLAVIFAGCPKPMVALTRSCKIKRGFGLAV